jgi:hypothetical protein
MASVPKSHLNDSREPPAQTTEAVVVEQPRPSVSVAASNRPAFVASMLAAAGSAGLAGLVAILAWAVPGLGHLVERRWIRAGVFFLTVGALAVTGYLMRGNVFEIHSHDPFGTLGFLADAGSGVFYLLSRFLESAGPNVSRAIGDYGTRFIAAAGIVNVLGVCDAYEIARRRRR